MGRRKYNRAYARIFQEIPKVKVSSSQPQTGLFLMGAMTFLLQGPCALLLNW